MKGKQKCGEKKRNCKWSQAYSLICKAWWRWCHGMGMDGCLWNRPSQLYKTIFPTNIQENATRLIGKCFILHNDNDPKHPASSVKEFIRAKKWEVLNCPSQSPDLNPIWTWISPAEEENKGRNSPKQATIGIGCIKGWEKYFKGWGQVMSMGHRLTAVIVRKGSATK